MTKILLINDLHIGTSRESSTNPGLVRQANTEALATFEGYISKFNREKYDLIVNLGDSIRDESSKIKDIENLNLALKTFVKLRGKKVVIPGNHEYKHMNTLEISKIMREVGLEKEIPGYITINKTKYVWIDSMIGERDLAKVSDESLTWLRNNLNQDDNVVLFSHYSIPPLNGKDNFYFGSDYKFMSYVNGNKVMEILSNCKSAITINAHTHMASFKITGKIPSISALSFSENIVSMKYPDANPGIYSVIEISENTRTFKSYSGDFCFLSIEL